MVRHDRMGAMVAAGALALAACGGGGEGPAAITDPAPTSIATPKSALELAPFADCAQFKDYYSASLTRQILEGWGPCWGCELMLPMTGFTGMGAPAPATFGPEAAPAGSDAVRLDVSGTNVQEEGVDEADLIEADADGYFYVVRGTELLVVDAVPAEEMRIVARHAFASSGYARGLYLDEANRRLVVVLELAGPVYATGAPTVQRYGSGLLFIDVADPAAPAVTGWYWTEGWGLDSRRVGDRVHLVSRFAFRLPPSLQGDAGFHDLVASYYQARYERREFTAEELARRIEQRIDAAVAETAAADLLPAQHSGLGNDAVVALDCGAVHRPAVEHNLGLLLITSIGTDGSAPHALATVNNAWQLYASRQNLYLAQFSGGWWFDEAQTQQTAIYRFSLAGGNATPAGLGLVDGWTLNSYSFGEHDGFLRVATTERRFAPDRPWPMTNHLFVLGGPGNGLAQVGAVRDFIRDERIFSARFVGDRGYVVTFRAIDPLFTFDLANPAAPRVAGQVEIPGFSTYIHPLGADHLLTIGRDGTFRNFQLQIFDVSDLAAPALAHAYVPPLGPDDFVFSLAEYDPHAFTFFAPASLLSLPVQVGSPDPANSFGGFFALTASPAAGFAELGRIDHSQADPDGSGCPPEHTDDAAVCGDFAPLHYGWPLRSVVVDDGARTLLYTLSDQYLKVGDVTNLSATITSLPLAQ